MPSWWSSGGLSWASSFCRNNGTVRDGWYFRVSFKNRYPEFTIDFSDASWDRGPRVQRASTGIGNGGTEFVVVELLKKIMTFRNSKSSFFFKSSDDTKRKSSFFFKSSDASV